MFRKELWVKSTTVQLSVTVRDIVIMNIEYNVSASGLKLKSQSALNQINFQEIAYVSVLWAPIQYGLENNTIVGAEFGALIS